MGIYISKHPRYRGTFQSAGCIDQSWMNMISDLFFATQQKFRRDKYWHYILRVNCLFSNWRRKFACKPWRRDTSEYRKKWLGKLLINSLKQYHDLTVDFKLFIHVYVMCEKFYCCWLITYPIIFFYIHWYL
jgi:hypothetical protein